MTPTFHRLSRESRSSQQTDTISCNSAWRFAAFAAGRHDPPTTGRPMTGSNRIIATPRHAMVLAAGIGARMRPLTECMPKPLVPVGGRPLIDHVLDRLAAVDVEKAVVNIHHFADQIERHL